MRATKLSRWPDASCYWRMAAGDMSMVRAHHKKVLAHDAYAIFKNSASSITFTPSSRAFSNFDPASAPART